MSQRPTAPPRTQYRQFSRIGTRWADNDVYCHVNNAAYYNFFDTAVNGYLIEAGALDIHLGAVIGLVVETHCNHYTPLAFPQTVEAGLCVAHIGTSSVRYQIALFAQGEAFAAAAGHFVHVYVDRSTRRPVALPAALRAALTPLLLTATP